MQVLLRQLEAGKVGAEAGESLHVKKGLVKERLFLPPLKNECHIMEFPTAHQVDRFEKHTPASLARVRGLTRPSNNMEATITEGSGEQWKRLGLWVWTDLVLISGFAINSGN